MMPHRLTISAGPAWLGAAPDRKIVTRRAVFAGGMLHTLDLGRSADEVASIITHAGYRLPIVAASVLPVDEPSQDREPSRRGH